MKTRCTHMHDDDDDDGECHVNFKIKAYLKDVDSMFSLCIDALRLQSSSATP